MYCEWIDASDKYQKQMDEKELNQGTNKHDASDEEEQKIREDYIDDNDEDD